jgi:hypothetical protein
LKIDNCELIIDYFMPRRTLVKNKEKEAKKTAVKKKVVAPKKSIKRTPIKKQPKIVVAAKMAVPKKDYIEQAPTSRPVIQSQISPADLERRNKLITWVGIATIMLVICSIWLMNLRKILKAGEAELANGSSSIKTINTDLLANLDNVKKGLEEIKAVQEKMKELKETPSAEQATTTKDIFNNTEVSSSTIEQVKYKLQLPTANAEQSLEQLKERLSDIATATPE